MTKRLRPFFYAAAICMVVLSVYALLFPSQLRCYGVAFMGMQQAAPGVYLHPGMDAALRKAFMIHLDISRARVQHFFGRPLEGDPTIIAGNSRQVMDTFGSPQATTGMNHATPLGSYMVLGAGGLNPDVISHELCHAEFLAHIGWWHREMEIPTWFDEGLALLLDYRFRDSEPMWRYITQDGAKAPPLSRLTSMRSFMEYTEISPLLSYYTAMREVKRWWEIVGIEGYFWFTEQIRKGTDFEKAYQAAEKKFGNKPSVPLEE